MGKSDVQIKEFGGNCGGKTNPFWLAEGDEFLIIRETEGGEKNNVVLKTVKQYSRFVRLGKYIMDLHLFVLY